MDKQAGSTSSRRPKISPVFAELYLTDDSDGDTQEQEKWAQRCRGKLTKRVKRSI